MVSCDICNREFKNGAGLAGHKQLKHRFEHSAQPLSEGSEHSAVVASEPPPQRSELLLEQLVERFGFDVEQLYLARHFGFQIKEVPVRWNDVEGTTVSTLAGVSAFVDIARVRWNSLTGKYG